MKRPVKGKFAEDDFVDVSSEGLSAKWSSLAAPLMPSLLMSREASSSLFDTPWRTKNSPAVLTRQAALYVLKTFENDLECQRSWISCCGSSLRSCLHLSAGEVIGWSYTFVFLLATLMGASSVSSALGLGSIVYRMYLVGCAQSFLAFVYETVCLLQDGPLLHAKALVKAKAKTFVLSMLASAVLPKDVLAAHMTACVLFGFMEKTLKCLFRMSAPSLIFLAKIKDMGNAYASRLVDAVIGTLKGKGSPKPPPDSRGPSALEESEEVLSGPGQATAEAGGSIDVSPEEEEEEALRPPPVASLRDHALKVSDSLPPSREEAPGGHPSKHSFQKNSVPLCSSSVSLDLGAGFQEQHAAAATAPLKTPNEASAPAPREEEGRRADGGTTAAPAPEKQLLKIEWKSSAANPRQHRRTSLPSE